MKIGWHCCNGLNGCDISDEVDVEDDATDEEIEKIVREEIFQRVEWTWWRKDTHNG